MKKSEHRKIEKQVQEYLRSFQFPEDVKKDLDKLEEERAAICREWSSVRDSFCTGSPCICVTHPHYKELTQKISVLDEAIKKIYQLKVQAGNEKQRLLQKAFYAKQRYFARKK